MRKLISLILIVSILLTLAVPMVSANEITFGDLIINGKKHWAYDTIMEVANRNIINGYPDGTFKPNNNVEVDAYIKLAVCALGNSFENGKDYWATPYINKAIELKLISSNEFNTYRRAITREEAAKVIVNALATTEQLPSDEVINKYVAIVKDYNKISDKYKKSVLYAYATGLIAGDPKGYYNPKSNLTRAEAATIIMRLLDKSLRKPVLSDAQVKTELPELLKSDAEVWGRERIYDLTFINGYTVKDGKIYFLNEADNNSNYELKNTLNSDISGQIYRATKVLMDDNHYVLTKYSYDDPSRAFVCFAKSSAYAFNSSYFFQYIFYEKDYDNVRSGWNTPSFSDKSFITLNLYALWRSADKNSWSTPYYETKLKHSLMAIFGESEGKQIYDYIYSVYIDKRNSPTKYTNKRLTKAFTTVRVDFANDDSSSLYFYFSKVGE